MDHSIKKLKRCICLLLCFVAGTTGLYAQSEDSLLQALKLATHDTARIKTLTELAEACDKSDILKYAIQCKTLCEKGIAAHAEPAFFYQSNLGGAINNIGYYYSKHGDQAKALANYKESLNIFEQIDDKKTAAYELNNIAFIYDNQGDVATALEYFYRNLKLQEEIRDTVGIAFSLNNIAYVFLNQQDDKAGMDYYSRSLKMFEAAGHKNGMAMSYGNIGTIYTGRKDKDKALEYYNRSLSLYEELDDKFSSTYELAAIGHEYVTWGEDEKALPYLNRALKTAEAFQIKEVLSYTLSNIATVLLKKGKTDSAEKYALRSLQFGKETGMPKDIRNAAGILKDIYVKKANYREAFTMYGLEIQMRDSLDNQTSRKATVTKKLQYQYEKKELEVKLANERKMTRKNWLIAGALFAAALVALLSFFYTRQHRLTTKLERMELEQQQYRSQMNPHFIFNCLNSIQYYIVHNDVVAANKYLSEFASLMRKTLENNQLHSIDLQQEIDYLNSYLTLEQMRFENKFTYEIICAPGINLFNTKILPMVIQPFAENAIVHGLCYLEKDGKLLIHFEKKGDYLICNINDNGIGRQASQELKKQTGKAHVSQGMELIEKRLALVSTINKKKFSVDIIDKIAEDGKAAGTLVVLKFPVDV